MSGLRQKLPALALMLILLPQSHSALGESPVESSRFEWRTVESDSDDVEVANRPRRQPAKRPRATETEKFDDPVPEVRAPEPEQSPPVSDSARNLRASVSFRNRSVPIADVPQTRVRPRTNWFEDDGITPLVRRVGHSRVSTWIPRPQGSSAAENSTNSTAPITSSEVFSAIWLNEEYSARRFDIGAEEFDAGQVNYLDEPLTQVPLAPPPPPAPAPELSPVPDDGLSMGSVETPLTPIPESLYEEPTGKRGR